jgi:hypothetical protein
MDREDLPKRLIEAGAEFLRRTDDWGMSAQGAMWLYSSALKEWRYYLVTSLMDTAGRRSVYKTLVRLFERFPMFDYFTVEDVHLGSPSDHVFRAISMNIHIDNGVATDTTIGVGDVTFFGHIYRSVDRPPTKRIAEALERKFKKRLKELAL